MIISLFSAQNRSVRAVRYRNDGSGNQCREEGYFADENDCRAFVRCVLRGDGGYDMYRFMCGVSQDMPKSCYLSGTNTLRDCNNEIWLV